jgi:hypothetical protein
LRSNWKKEFPDIAKHLISYKYSTLYREIDKIEKELLTESEKEDIMDDFKTESYVGCKVPKVDKSKYYLNKDKTSDEVTIKPTKEKIYNTLGEEIKPIKEATSDIKEKSIKKIYDTALKVLSNGPLIKNKLISEILGILGDRVKPYHVKNTIENMVGKNVRVENGKSGSKIFNLVNNDSEYKKEIPTIKEELFSYGIDKKIYDTALKVLSKGSLIKNKLILEILEILGKKITFYRVKKTINSITLKDKNIKIGHKGDTVKLYSLRKAVVDDDLIIVEEKTQIKKIYDHTSDVHNTIMNAMLCELKGGELDQKSLSERVTKRLNSMYKPYTIIKFIRSMPVPYRDEKLEIKRILERGNTKMFSLVSRTSNLNIEELCPTFTAASLAISNKLLEMDFQRCKEGAIKVQNSSEGDLHNLKEVSDSKGIDISSKDIEIKFPVLTLEDSKPKTEIEPLLDISNKIS